MLIAFAVGPLLVLACATSPDVVSGRAAQLFQLTEAVSDIGLATDLRFLPDGRMVIIEKSGEVRIRTREGAMALAGKLEVDEESEKGLLGVEVDPDFSKTRRLFFYYSAADSAGGTDLDRHRVVSMLLGADGKLKTASEKILVRGLRGPYNHDGGGLAIGPDGKLYIGVGDTGCNSGRRPEPPYDPTNYFGTCLSNGNGKILRVNLDGSIPSDNPFASTAAAIACAASCRDAVNATVSAPPRRDIWAWGFRNPWRFSFDARTGKLWVGDVGEVTYEEVSIAEKGRHHGWPWREGRHGWPISRCAEMVAGGQPCVEPIYECTRSGRKGADTSCDSITGGVIVDSCHWPAEYRGRYLFADNVNGRIFALKLNAARDGVTGREELARIQNGVPVSMQVGPDGDVYVAVMPGPSGRIVRFAPKSPVACSTNPARAK